MKNGRTSNGRFGKGNPGGPGNPHARRVGQIRAKLMAAVSDDDIDAVIRALVDQARAGEPWATKEVLTRLIGDARITEDDPTPFDDLDFGFGEPFEADTGRRGQSIYAPRDE